MGIIGKVLGGLLLFGLLSVIIVVQHQVFNAEKNKTAILMTEKAERDRTIQHLKEAEASNRKRLAQLQTEQHRIQTRLSEREIFIEKLHHDNPTIQAWADAALPDAIVRLRYRTEASGASNAHPELPDHESLLPASSQSTNQR